MRHTVNCSCTAAFFLVLAACSGGGSEPTTPPPPPPGPAAVATVTVSPDAAPLTPGATAQFSAALKDASGHTLTGRSVTWSSTAENVATVNAAGRATAVGGGTATIRATSEGKSGEATVTVTIPVVSIALNDSSESLVPLQSFQLLATLRDAQSNILTGPAVTWSSTAATIASVDNQGLVSAVAVGSANITATSEGTSVTASITVMDGAFVGPAGVSTVAAGGNVGLTIPAGAVPAGMALSVAPTTTIPALPASVHLMNQPAYQLGPNGTQFASPVTVTLRYDPAKLAPWALPSSLRILRWNGTVWNELTNIAVDTVARTVSGETSGFSLFGVGLSDPNWYVDPASGSVNSTSRSVIFDVIFSDPIRPSYNFQYEWATTGSNGNLGAQFGSTMQYIAVTPILPGGDLDIVEVKVLGQSEPAGPYYDLGTKSMVVKSDLTRTIELNPLTQAIDFGAVTQLTTVIRDESGAAITGAQFDYQYTTAANNGSLFPSSFTPPGPERIAEYTARPLSTATPNPPRVDKVTVKVRESIRNQGGTISNPTVFYTYQEIGTAEAFVEVGKDWYRGRYQMETVPNGTEGGCVSAYVFSPKVTNATQYELWAHGFNDPAQYGTEYRRTFSGPTGTGFDDVQQVAGANGTEYRITLASGCSTTAPGLQGRQNAYAARFAGIEVQVKITVP